MDFNTIRSLPDGWEEPEFLKGTRTGLGPTDLAEVLLHFRNYRRDFDAPVSDAGVRKILEMAFYTSLEKNEGRSPRFCLRLADPSSFRFVAQLAPPRPLESSLLRKLWPASGYPYGALAVSERTRDGGFVCEGLSTEEVILVDAIPGRPEIAPVGGSLSAFIHVDDPGSMACDIGSLINYQLRAGRIRQVVPWSRIPGCQEFLGHAARSLVKKCAEEVGDVAFKCFGGASGLQTQLAILWGDVLARSIAARHGGTFLVLPYEVSAAEPNWETLIENHFGLDPTALTQAIVRMWTAYIKANANVEDHYQIPSGSAHECSGIRREVIKRFRGLSDLSLCDGCVVLDQNMQVHGFAGHIKANGRESKKRPLRNAKTGEEFSRHDLQELGTRHHSAINYCRIVPRSIAFVISQDGAMSVFYSDEESVYGFGPVAGGHHTNLPFPV